MMKDYQADAYLKFKSSENVRSYIFIHLTLKTSKKLKKILSARVSC